MELVQAKLLFPPLISVLKENQEETAISENPNGDEEGGEESLADGVGDFEDEDEAKEDEEEEGGSKKSRELRLVEDGSKLESMFRRLASEKVKLRVHDVLIKGNTKTKDSLIEAELEAIKNATTMQEAATLLHAPARELTRPASKGA
uniref:Uncharacterized protein n=1 Tax=Vitis vinifera TaxID=29760 RepID=F6H9C8_VITVI